MQRERVGKVKHVACLAGLEESGVALGGNLLNLPLHRRQHDAVLARNLVRIYFYTMAGCVSHRLVLTLAVGRERLVTLGKRTVLYVIDQP